MILRVDARSPVPPFEQLRAQVTTMVQTGVLADGARLPPIRQLAGDLGIAPGTVARAYRELEGDGVVATRGRHGTVVTAGGAAAAPAAERRRQIDAAAAAFAIDAAHHGADLDLALDAVRTAFGALTRSRRPA